MRYYTYTVSAPIQVLQFYLSGTNAEDYRDFLLHLLKKDWKSDEVKWPYQSFSKQELNVLNNAKFKGHGLYFIFGRQDKKEDQNYPLYIGQTGNTFEQRIEDHIENWLENPMYMDTEKQSDGKTDIMLTPIAYLVNMPLPVAKFFESVFLSTFDFPKNNQENNGVREEIWIRHSQSVAAGRELFLKNVERIISNLVQHVNSIYQFQKLTKMEGYRLI